MVESMLIRNPTQHRFLVVARPKSSTDYTSMNDTYITSELFCAYLRLKFDIHWNGLTRHGSLS